MLLLLRQVLVALMSCTGRCYGGSCWQEAARPESLSNNMGECRSGACAACPGCRKLLQSVGGTLHC
jgi:hypothetical protein